MRPHGQFTWTDLSAPDPAAASAFYRGLFGWSGEDQTDPDGNYIYTMFSKDGKSVAGLGAQPQELQAAGIPPAWNSYITVDDLDATIDKVKGAGGSVMMDPMDVFDAGRMAFVADPEGAAMALWQAGQNHGAEVFNEPGAMTWNELATRDAEAAKTFYQAAFGWDYENMPDSGDYWVIKMEGKVDGDHDADDDFNGGIMPVTEDWPDEVPAYWGVYFLVERHRRVGAKAAELGGEILTGPFDTPAGRIAVVRDPQGATFNIISAPAE